jgi:DNA-binding transcriptional LysR family regulator
MEHLRRLSRFWNWLPAFRAVAECLHLPTAAREYCVTAPALSRAVHLLERDLGVPLFERVGRRLQLNASGRQFHDALRDAMRLVHEAALHLREEQLTGTVHVASAGVVTTTLLVPALEALRRTQPRLLPVVTTTPAAAELGKALRRGTLDIALHGPLPGLDQVPGLRTVSLGVATNAVYCGPGHPLYGRRRVTQERILVHPFVAPATELAAQNLDGWPPHVARQVALRVDQLRVGLEVCLRGQLLAVLSDALVQAHPLAESLWRLPFPGLADDLLFATLRASIGLRTRAEVVLAQVQEVVHRGTPSPGRRAPRTDAVPPRAPGRAARGPSRTAGHEPE